MYCQKCRAPLKLDSSLEDLNPAAFDLLVGASANQQAKNLSPSRVPYPNDRKHLYDRVSKDAVSPTFKRNIPSRRHDPMSDTLRGGLGNLGESFAVLTESQVVPPAAIKPSEDANGKKPKKTGVVGLDGTNEETKAMSQDMERASRLFEVLSARSDIDHPVCVECTEMVVAGLQKRLNASTRERDAYVGFLKQIQLNRITEEELKESQEALAKARKDEEAAMKELEELEQEKAAVDKEILQLEDESRALDLEEERFWRERNDFAMKLADFQNVRDSINLQYDHDSQLLEKLQRTNVYNDTFCISHDGKFGTINGLRLGRLSNVPVDWPEINAAWGHTVLLLQTVADKLDFKFRGYELQPMGSTSRIIKLETPSPSTSRSGSERLSTTTTRSPKRSVLELFSSGDMPLGLTFIHRHFDTAMVAFLECMRQLGAHVETETAKDGRGLALPYKIDGDKIDGVSIKLGFGAQDDAWSRACKFTLTCCKFLLAHASNVNAGSRR